MVSRFQRGIEYIHAKNFQRIIYRHMNIKNVEFKAKVDQLEPYENRLLTLKPHFVGEDHQVDTYFNTLKGRLKLREGNIENALIQYEREDIAEAKASKVILYKHKPNPALKAILTQQLGIKVVVEKQRRIYWIDHVKFHFDRVKGLGTFIEVEVIDEKEEFSLEQLREKCNHYLTFFGIADTRLVEKSYSDMLHAL